MQKHVVVALSALFLIGGMVVVFAPTIVSAISGIDTVYYEGFLKNVNTSVQTDIGNKEIRVFKGTTNVRNAFERIGNNGGSFLSFADPENLSRLMVFVRDTANKGEIFVYELGNDGIAYQMDCSAWLDGETNNVLEGIVKEKNTFTAQEFLDYYNCASYTTFDFINEDTEGLAQFQTELKTTSKILQSTYTPDLFVDFSIDPLIKAKEQSEASDPDQTDLTTAPEYTAIQSSTPTEEIGTGFSHTKTIPFLSATVDDVLKNDKVLFLTNGDKKKRYVLDVWKFIKLKDQEKYEIGLRLFLVDEDKIVNQWSTVTYSPTYTKNGTTPISKKVTAGDRSVIVDFKNGKETTALFQFQSTGNQSRGNVTVTLKLVPTATIGTTTTIGGLNYIIDFAEDYPYNLRNVLRFELTDEAFAKIVALPEFEEFKADKPGLYDSEKISFLMTKGGEPDITFLRPSDNSNEITEVGQPFFRSETGQPVRPGHYGLEMKLEGYEDVKISDLLISWADLSLEKTDSHTIITKLKLPDLKSDPCGKCTTLQACTVCMDHQIIQHYTKETP
ncbi:MAG: hypothetical protein AABX02_01910 [archaeon]